MTKRIILESLKPNQAYTIQVRAKSDGTPGAWSPKFSFTTIAYNTKPAMPTNVTWTAVGDSFHAEWDKVTTNETGATLQTVDRYEIELVGTPGNITTYASVPQTTQAGKVTYDLTYLENVAKFIAAKPTVAIRVCAVDLRGIKSDWTTQISAGNAAPPAPTGLTASANNEYIDLKWNAVTADDLVGYNLYLSTNGAAGTYNKVYTGNALNYTFPSAMYTTDHYFQVKAVDTFGLESAASNTAGPVRPKSSFSVDTVPPAVPTGLTATSSNNADGQSAYASVSWTAPSDTDLAGFVLRYRKSGSSDNYITETYDKGTTSAMITLPAISTAYDFQVRAFDWQANYSAYTAIVTASAPTNTAPSTPTAPSVAANTLQIQVTPNGTKAAGGGPMESDVEYYEVYASTTNGFTEAATNMLGVIPVGPAMSVTFPVPASGGGATQTWYVKVIAVDAGGLKSSASAQATATPGLIGTSNIVDLAVTNAKINDLGVDKLTAGNGIINDLTVKSTMTLGTSTTNGVIQSFDYAAGSMGFRLEKNNLEINKGTIAASVITLTSTFADNVGANMTTIDGGIIKTGSIQSQTNTTINGVSVPLWSIPTNGSATFANLTVRGLTIVGTSGDAGAAGRSTIQSANYNGSVGWKIDANGDAYFASGTFKGNITGATGTFSGNITGSAATVTGSITGNTVQTSSSSTYVVRMDSQGFRMYGASSSTPLINLDITNGNATFAGDISGATGTFKGDVKGGIFQTSNTGSNYIKISDNAQGGTVDWYYGNAKVGGIRGQWSNNTLIFDVGTSSPSFQQSGSNGLLTINSLVTTSIGNNGSSIQFTDNITFNSFASINGGVTLNGGPTVNAGITINGGITMGTSATISGLTTINGGPTINGSPTWTAPGTGGSANVNWNNGKMQPITSSRRYKENIRDLEVDLDNVYALVPRKYERVTAGTEVGFIAEEALEVGLTDWVVYNDDGEVESFDYFKYVVALQAAVVDLNLRLDNLENGN